LTCRSCPTRGTTKRRGRCGGPGGRAQVFPGVGERCGVKYYFATDDNFFNRRETAEAFFEELARTRIARGKRLGHQVRWSTEATQFDTWKNRDLLPLAREAGPLPRWFAPEALTARAGHTG